MVSLFPCIKRFSGNPIIEPKRYHRWESEQTFNPGAILLADIVHILYRALGDDGISRFGYAASERGYIIEDRVNYPVYEHAITSGIFSIYSYNSGGSYGGAEDPRIVHVSGDDSLYLTYTAADAGLRMALTSIKIDDFVSKKWKWSKPVLISPPGQIHKNWVIFPEKIDGKYAILHSLNPQIEISYHENLHPEPGDYYNDYINGQLTHRKDSWDDAVRGAGPPPIKTDKGWLLFYHAMTLTDYGRYKVGAMILDLKDPRIILYRSANPVLEPSEVYENNGFKAGVIYLSGAVVKNGELLLYYGASDSYVCVASCRLDEFLNEIVKTNTNNFQIDPLKNPSPGLLFKEANNAGPEI